MKNAARALLYLVIVAAACTAWAAIGNRIGYDRGHADGYREGYALERMRFSPLEGWQQTPPFDVPLVDTPGVASRTGYAWQWQVNPEGELLYRRLGKSNINVTLSGLQGPASPDPDPRPDPKRTPEHLTDSDFSKVESAIWYRYFTAELNVRYRARVGDDGAGTLWADQRDRCAAAWAMDRPTQEVADDLYRSQVRVQCEEGPDVDVAVINAIQDELDREVNAGTFPPVNQ